MIYNNESATLRDEVEYGFDPDLHPDNAERVIRAVARFRDNQPSPEHSPITCYDCEKHGYQAVCYTIALEDATPKTWRTVIVCTDCADRDDPLCGVEPTDLSHPLVKGCSDGGEAVAQ